MRPGDFSPGNLQGLLRSWGRLPGFNEAGGFLPRKLMARQTPSGVRGVRALQ